MPVGWTTGCSPSTPGSTPRCSWRTRTCSRPQGSRCPMTPPGPGTTSPTSPLGSPTPPRTARTESSSSERPGARRCPCTCASSVRTGSAPTASGTRPSSSSSGWTDQPAEQRRRPPPPRWPWRRRRPVRSTSPCSPSGSAACSRSGPTRW